MVRINKIKELFPFAFKGKLIVIQSDCKSHALTHIHIKKLTDEVALDLLPSIIFIDYKTS